MINLLSRTREFDTWLDSIKDPSGRTAVLTRLDRAVHNNFGDCEPVGDGMSELRVFVGPGYRVYFTRIGLTTYMLLWGSDKSDQRRGIKRAKEILNAARGNRT